MQFTESSLKIDQNTSGGEYLDYLLSNYHAQTGNWRLDFLRLSDDNSKAFAIFHYYSDNKSYKVTAIRNLSETKSFYSWKILH
jgi:hypothetical protein